MRTLLLTLGACLWVSAASACPEHAHSAESTASSTAAYQSAMEKMHHEMDITYTGDADADFVAGMIPHHAGAVDMAKTELKYGKDPELRKLAKDIVAAQEREIRFMKKWQAAHPAKQQ